MRCLTIRQPWAWAIAAGHKTVENRTWGTDYRGPLAIHAGREFDRRARSSALIRQAARAAVEASTYGYLSEVTRCGVVVAVAELVDVHEADGCCRPWGDHGLYVRGGRGWRTARHWVLADVRQLDRPLAATGRLGLWDVDLPPNAIGGA